MLINNRRELAYTVKIDAIEPIIGSDNCEAAVVGGWKVMTRKGTFKPGDIAVYFEIDSKVPETETYAFLEKKHYKVKTQKYTFGGKGCFISQGLLMALSDFETNGGMPTWLANLKIMATAAIVSNEEERYEKLIHIPLTDELGVKYSVAEDNKRKASVDKYKRMAQRHWKLFKHNKLVQWLYKKTWGKKILFLFLGKKRDKKASFWPEWVVKTDEERVQNLPQLFPGDDTRWIVTEKIDGTSTTFTMKREKRNKYNFYVCSRNVCFDKPEKECFYETNVYTEMAEKYDIENVLHEILFEAFDDKKLDFVTIQGETYGKGIQQRDYHMEDVKFMAFNVIFGYSNGEVKRLNPIEMNEFLDLYNVPCVPVLDENFKLPETIEDMVAYADGDSTIDGDYREGVVLRTEDGVNSFKAVSNYYLTTKYSNE